MNEWSAILVQSIDDGDKGKVHLCVAAKSEV